MLTIFSQLECRLKDTGSLLVHAVSTVDQNLAEDMLGIFWLLCKFRAMDDSVADPVVQIKLKSICTNIKEIFNFIHPKSHFSSWGLSVWNGFKCRYPSS